MAGKRPIKKKKDTLKKTNNSNELPAHYACLVHTLSRFVIKCTSTELKQDWLVHFPLGMETGSWLESIILDYLVVSFQLLLLAGTKELVHFWKWLKSIMFENLSRVWFPGGECCVLKGLINGAVVVTQQDTWGISSQIQAWINVFCYF